MILCTNCGTRNPDHSHQCANCKRKLQSRYVAAANGQANGNGANGGNGVNGQNGQNGGNPAEPAWHVLAPFLRVADEPAAQMVKQCAEIWSYAALLLVSAVVMVWTQEWGYLAAGIALAAGLAKMRGL